MALGFHPHSNAPLTRRFILVRRCLVALILGTLAFLVVQEIAPRIGYSVIRSDNPHPADLILVLGGDFWGPRVVQAAELAVLGYAPVVLISGPPYGDRPEGERAIEFVERLGYPGNLFRVFAHHAASTVDEAVALRHELERRGVKRVLVVTSAYHSRRAYIVLRLFCPGIQFTSVPAADFLYLPDRWWSDSHSRSLVFSEWSKILGSVLVSYPSYEIRKLVAHEETNRQP